MAVPLVNQIRDFKALEIIHHSPPSVHGHVDAHKALSDLIPDKTTKQNWITDKINEGYLIKAKSIQRVRLSAKGEHVVVEGEAKRQDVSAFRKEMRIRLVKWANNRSRGADDMHDVDPDSNDFWYYGRTVTLDDIELAARYLERHDLLTFTSEISLNDSEVLDVMVGITVDGQDCCEEHDGDIASYLKDKRATAGQSGTTFHIQNVIGSNIVAGDNNTVKSAMGQQDAQQVIAMGQAHRQSLPALGMMASVEEIAMADIQENNDAPDSGESFVVDKSHQSGMYHHTMNDVVGFRAAVRVRLLRWAYKNSKGVEDHVGVALDDQESSYHGRVISLDDLARAAKEMSDKKLLWQKSLGTWDEPIVALLVGITHRGQECVEEYDANIKEYLKAKREELNMSGTNISIGHQYGGNVSVGNGNKLVSTVGAINTQQITGFAGTFRRMLPALELDEPQRHEAEQYAADLEKADDPSKVRIALEWIKNLALTSTSDGVAELLANKASELLQVLHG